MNQPLVDVSEVGGAQSPGYLASEARSEARLERVSFRQLVEGRYFVIPDYQRHYAWQRKQCEELLEDCILTARSQPRERFMSTITVIEPGPDRSLPPRHDADDRPLRPLLVVDGQQRLTSLMILVAAIAGRMRRGEPSCKDAQRALSDLVGLHGEPPQLRLVPQSIPSHPHHIERSFLDALSRESAKKRGAPEILIPAQRRLQQTREIFDERLRHLVECTPAELLACVEHKLVFVLNLLPDIGRAGEVFEGLNNRGLGLSPLENLKAYAIYAVQSFRRAEALPGMGDVGASALNDDFNDAVGDIYHHLDRVALPDDATRDMLCAAWPLFNTAVEVAELSKNGAVPEALDRQQPVERIRTSLHLHNAHSDEEQGKLLRTLSQIIRPPGLVNASRYFADIRRPEKDVSFTEFRQDRLLGGADLTELRALHQRLVEMENSAPFAPLLIAYRAAFPRDAAGYLRLARVAERAAFHVYVLAGRKASMGQQRLLRLARDVADQRFKPADILRMLASFAASEGKDMDESTTDERVSFKERLDATLDGNENEAWGALAYEWLMANEVELPRYGRFVRLLQEGKALRLVNPKGKGKLPAGYALPKNAMDHPGNIVILRGMPEMTNGERAEFNMLPYPDKRQQLKSWGYEATLPYQELTEGWAASQRRQIVKLAFQRWAIPDDGRIDTATWSKTPIIWTEDDDDNDDAG